MSIPVVCSGCQKRFNVDDKHAGKKGPCPNCKTIITIPTPLKDEVKVHVPEEFQSGGKDAKGRAVLKPVARKDARFRPRTAAAIVAAAAVVVGGAFLARGWETGAKYGLIALGLAAITPPLVVAGYSFLRDDELEAYTGKSLWLRAVVCAAVYALLWACYWPVSGTLTGELWQWLVVAPLFVAFGALASFATLDLEPTNAAIHYGFFLAVTLLLRWAIGLPPVWGALTL